MDAGNLLTKVSDNLSVRRAFGTAYEKGDMLIIPVAVVAGGGGAAAQSRLFWCVGLGQPVGLPPLPSAACWWSGPGAAVFQ